jgi:Ser/Thr protein kinase RdoA (MazF antagonist)
MNENLPHTSPFVKALLKKVEDITGESVKKIDTIDEDATQNKNFIVTTTSNTYFLKAYSEGSIDERTFELNILRKLYSDGHAFPVQATAEPFIVEDRPVMLFNTINGSTFDPHVSISNEHLLTVARQLAQMHLSLSTFKAGEKKRFNALGFEFIDVFNLDTTDETVKKALHILRNAFKNVNMDELVTTIIHDDLSPHNVMLSDNGNLRFIDFDDAHRSYRISDIGTVVKEFIVTPSETIDEDKINLFISHYEATHNTPPLTDQEKLLLSPMILRRALFMYAYYSMVEKERHLYLQSDDEYRIVTALTL